MNGVNVRVYSKAKDGSKALSANFRVREFACKDGSDVILIAPELVNVLQKVRNYFARPVTITSAYRTPSHNKREGGEQFSQHQYGTAADIVVTGITPARVAKYVESLMPNTGGIGIYKNFTHIDTRVKKARWRG